MALPLQHTEGPAHRRRADALGHRPAVDEDLLDVEPVHVHVILAVLGVGDRRLQALLDVAGRLPYLV